MVIDISVAIIAVAFLALVIYLILTLQSLRQTFNHLNAALAPIQRHTEDLCEQAENLLDQTTRLTKDLKHKSEALESVFHSVANVGESLEKITKKNNQLIPPNVQQHANLQQHAIPVEEMVEWVLLGCQLFKKLKDRR